MPGHEDLVAIIPAPKSIDPRMLAWKGASVLAKLESVNDLWVQHGDWVCPLLPYNVSDRSLL